MHQENLHAKTPPVADLLFLCDSSSGAGREGRHDGWPEEPGARGRCGAGFRPRRDRQPIPADLNGDWVVNAFDLSLLLSGWGSIGPGDINNDGIVSAADMSLLLDSWG